ncbi:MAG: helix-turn-helix transcriptional regulator [Thermoplasmata archaeon]|nr:helix-turn-helix transcriptional regulator [Thermoplasmata archaeon]
MTECCSGPLACPCPPVGLVDVVGKKWGICVVTLIGHHRQLRFGPIQRSLPRVSPATLSATLRSLEQREIVCKVPISGDGRASAAYTLTESGSELYRSMLPMAKWLRRNHNLEIHSKGRS